MNGAPDRQRPRLFQAHLDVPIFDGSDANGNEQRCSRCGSLLLVGLHEDALFAVDLVCAGCGTPTSMPDFPAGRGLGSIVRHVVRDHQFVGTFLLDMHEVVVGPSAQRQRDAETGANRAPPARRELNLDGIEELIADAEVAFEPILAPLDKAAARHPARRRVAALHVNLEALIAGGNEVDLRAAVRVLRPMDVFSRWSEDPSGTRMFSESLDPGTFDHNIALLEVASVFQASGLGPELVSPGLSRTADLVLRIAAGVLIDIDIKTPKALRWPESGTIELVEPRKIIKKALRTSRGQFARDGILVIAGESWWNGVDEYAQAARALLHEPLSGDAGPEAKAHYEQLLGLILVSLGYSQQGQGYALSLTSRWVPNPRYAGSLDLHLDAELDGPFTLSFPSTPDAAPEPSIDLRGGGQNHFDGHARFRLIGDHEVELDGLVANHRPGQSSVPTAIWCFPQRYRPAEDLDFDVACESGFTTLAVRAGGDVLCDPTVGWVDLRGVRFPVA